MEVKVEKDKKENYPVFLDGESVTGKVRHHLQRKADGRDGITDCFQLLG